MGLLPKGLGKLKETKLQSRDTKLKSRDHTRIFCFVVAWVYSIGILEAPPKASETNTEFIPKLAKRNQSLCPTFERALGGADFFCRRSAATVLSLKFLSCYLLKPTL
jgi:hypothetical protein